MCLESITTQKEKPSPLVISGWKGFNGTEKNPTFYAVPGSKVKIELDTWIKAEKLHDDAGSHIRVGGGAYAPGFHGFTGDLKSLPSGYGRFKLQVFYRGIHTIGRQSGCDVYVADELYIPSKPDGWPPKPARTNKSSNAGTSGGGSGAAVSSSDAERTGSTVRNVLHNRRSTDVLKSDVGAATSSGSADSGASLSKSERIVRKIREVLRLEE